MAALVEAALTFVLLPFEGKGTDPLLTGAGEDNFSAFTTVLIVADISFSDVAVAVAELELTFVDISFSPARFYFVAILLGSEIKLDFVVLDNIIHSFVE